ncbi:MAG: ankyrin repeat domain-containing protein [Armatimonadetes bacterium]|nr:ankyrin repeat domain-containing protein [Armatimonadota bacterium]
MWRGAWLFCCLALGGPALAQSPTKAVQAVKKALPVLQATGRTWYERASCMSCHHQSVPFIAQAIAKDNGIKFDTKTLDAQYAESAKRRAKYTNDMYELAGAINGNSGHGYQVLSQIALGKPADQYTDALEFYLTSQQSADGRWVSTSHRPPIEDSEVTTTATSIRALTAYGTTPRAKRAVQRGLAYLKSAKPTDGEERAYRLLGLVWAGADHLTVKSARQAVLDHQDKDGGWAQVSGRPSDAYATGLSMVALRASGGAARSQAMTRGASWLLAHQQKDGTWHVKTRRVVEGLPYFETGFPYGFDQFISCTATGWATAALAVYGTDGHVQALTTKPKAKRREPRVVFSKDTRLDKLFHAVTRGSAADVAAALKAGAPADGTVFGKVTPLMLATRDSEMVHLLLQSRANPNAKSSQATTPLIMAARSDGGRESMRLLLAAGADPAVSRLEGKETPLTLAAVTYDLEKLKMLLDTGLKLDEASNVALFEAANIGDMAAVDYLLSRGANPLLENKEYGGNLINDMVVNRDPVMVARFLKAGVKPNVIDKEGWSALQVAAQSDPADAAIVQMLLAAGADPHYETKDKAKPLLLAKQRGNVAAAKLISDKMSQG